MSGLMHSDSFHFHIYIHYHYHFILLFHIYSTMLCYLWLILLFNAFNIIYHQVIPFANISSSYFILQCPHVFSFYWAVGWRTNRHVPRCNRTLEAFEKDRLSNYAIESVSNIVRPPYHFPFAPNNLIMLLFDS